VHTILIVIRLDTSTDVQTFMHRSHKNNLFKSYTRRIAYSHVDLLASHWIYPDQTMENLWAVR